MHESLTKVLPSSIQYIMRNRYTLIILLLIAFLGGLAYFLGSRASDDVAAASVNESEAGSNPAQMNSDAALEGAMEEQEPEPGSIGVAGAVNDENKVGDKGAGLARSGQTHIMQLIKGAKLLDEATVTGAKGQKTIRVYDVGSRFKYPFVRVETLEAETGAGPMTAMVADHLIVRVKDLEASSEQVGDRMQEMGLMVRKTMHTAGHFLVSPNPESTVRPSFLLESLQDQLGNAVEVAEPDFIVFTTEVIPDDPSFDRLWGLHNTGPGSAVEDADIDAPEAWEITTGSRSIKVGVIDTGVDYDHPDLAANMWTNPGEIAGDGIDNDNNGFVDDIHGWDFAYDDSDPMDVQNHGTHCAGTIGAVGDNGLGVAGVNWEVTIVALKFLNDRGSGAISDAIDALNYAVLMDLDLTSNSWGGGGSSELMKAAIGRAGEANQLFVAAAGNDSSNMEYQAHYPASYSFDAELDNIISVASLDSADHLSGFSNYGITTTDLGAPGSAIYSTIPGARYASFSGTSMAAPHVSGALALYLSVTDVEFKKAKEDLLESVDEIPALTDRCVSEGRLNVFNLLMKAKVPFLKVASIVEASDLGESQIHSPGETVTMELEFENKGLEDAMDVVAELRTTDSEIELLVDRLELGDIGAQSVQKAASLFRFRIPESVVAPKGIPFEIVMKDGAGQEWLHAFEAKVNDEITITGRVQVFGSGSPLEGVAVAYSSANNSNGPSLSGEVVTDANGVFSFQGIAGQVMVRLEKAGYLTMNREIIAGAGELNPFVMRSPRIEYDSDRLVIEVLEGETAEAAFEFSNVGDSYMSYQVGSGGSGRIGLRAPVPVTVEHTIEDSFVWSDISESGTVIELGDDTVSERINLGFNFHLYEKDYQSLKVGSNGLLLFKGETNPYANVSLREVNAPNEALAYFWSDLNFESSGATAFYKREPGKIIFQFKEVPFFVFSTKKVSAQVILSDDDSVTVYYKKIDNPTGGTVGIRGDGLAQVHEVSYGHSVLSSGSTLLIKQNNGKFGYVNDSGSGVLQAGDTKRIGIKLNAGSLTPGVYRDSFKLTGEWADYDGGKEIEIELRVLPAPNFQVAETSLTETGIEFEGVSQNDGDGFVEAGETAELALSLENVGSVDSSLLSAEIVSDSPHVEVVQQDSSFEAIVAGETGTCGLPFAVKFDEMAALGDPLKMYVKLLDTNQRIQSIPFELEVLYNHEISGHVTELGAGEPLSGVTIRCGEEITQTDLAGFYRLEMSQPGSYSLTASKEHYESIEQSLELPERPSRGVVDFALSSPMIGASADLLDFVLYQGEVFEGEIELLNRGTGSLQWEITSSMEWKNFKGYELKLDTPYVWDDISTRGRNISMNDDVVIGPVSLEQSFEFYGKRFENLYVSSNGFISFDEDFAPRYDNTALEDSSTGLNKLAFFWKDLVIDGGSSGRCYTHTEADGTFVLQFSNVPEYFYGHRVWAQARLKPDGSIRLIYSQVDNADEVVVGLKGNNSREVFDVLSHVPEIKARSVFELKPQAGLFGKWEDSMGGTIDKDSVKLRFTIDATGLAPGRYHHYIEINSNDVHGKKLLRIPVRLVVYQNDSYESFMKQHQVPDDRRGILEDLDHDGLSNLEEFAFGLDPTSGEGASGLNLLSIISTANEGSLGTQNTPSNEKVLNFEYSRRTDEAGLDYLLQSCEELMGEWQTIEARSETTRVTSDANIEKVHVTIPLDATKPNRFYRIEVVPR